MSTLLVQSGTFDDIADAIRAKTGKVASMTPLEMPQEIASISGGGGVTILSGTSEPTSAQGNNGQIYLKYSIVGENLTEFTNAVQSDMSIIKSLEKVEITYRGGQNIGAEVYKQIDLTDIDEIKITIYCGNNAYNNDFTNRHPRLVITTSNPSQYPTSPAVAEVSTKNTSQDFTIDVSSYTGTYYVIFTSNGCDAIFSEFIIDGDSSNLVIESKLKVNGNWQNLIGSDFNDVNLGGGGSGITETLLWTNSGTSNTNIELSESYENFDILRFVYRRKGSGYDITPPIADISVENIKSNPSQTIQMYAYSSAYAAFNPPTTDPKTTFTYLGGSEVVVMKVYGIKYS